MTLVQWMAWSRHLFLEFRGNAEPALEKAGLDAKKRGGGALILMVVVVKSLWGNLTREK